MKIWKWFKYEAIGIIYIILILLVIIGGIFSLSSTPASKPAQIDCSQTYDKEARRLIEKIDEQGQLIGAYKARYRGLTRLGD